MKIFYVAIVMIISHILIGLYCSLLYTDTNTVLENCSKNISCSYSRYNTEDSPSKYSSTNTRTWTAIGLELEKLAQKNKVVGAVLIVLGLVVLLLMIIGYLLYLIPYTVFIFYATGYLWYFCLSLVIFSIILYKRIKYINVTPC